MSGALIPSCEGSWLASQLNENLLLRKKKQFKNEFCRFIFIPFHSSTGASQLNSLREGPVWEEWLRITGTETTFKVLCKSDFIILQQHSCAVFRGSGVHTQNKPRWALISSAGKEYSTNTVADTLRIFQVGKRCWLLLCLKCFKDTHSVQSNSLVMIITIMTVVARNGVIWTTL